MEETIQHRVVAWWASGRTGIAKSNAAPNAIHFTAPPEFGGAEGRWTPEDLFLSALASCYTTTFRSIAEHSKLQYIDLEVTADGVVQKVGSCCSFSEILIGVNLIISDELEQERALRLLQKTEELCLVGRAISVPQKVEAKVKIHRAVAVR